MLNYKNNVANSNEVCGGGTVQASCDFAAWSTRRILLTSNLVHNCLPKGRHSEAAHEKRLLCAQKCTRGGVGWGRMGWVMLGWVGVGHAGVGWGGVGWVMQGCGGSHRDGVGHAGLWWVM